MSDPRNAERVLQAHFANLPTPDAGNVDEKVLADALTTMQRVKNRYAAPPSRLTWRRIMTSRLGKVAIAGLVLAVVASYGIFDSLSGPAWAIDQTIEAVKEYRAVHLVGTLPGRTFESWMRSNKSGTQSQECVGRDSNGGIAWVKNGWTYLYDPGPNTIYVEHAITQGFSQWLGPEFLEMFAKAKGAELFYGKDPATGRERVTLQCSLIDVDGPQSLRVEFDVVSKLPVSFTCWRNLDRSGVPECDATRITYYKDVPDSLFDVHIPGDPPQVAKPLTIPEENAGLLADPADGMVVGDLSQEEAAEKIVRSDYQAVIDGDLARIRQLSPLCRNWSDEMLRAVICKTGRTNRIVEILKVGPIDTTGESRLGPLVALPAVLRCADGTKIEEKMIVQFRDAGTKPSCVVYGPYGLARELE